MIVGNRKETIEEKNRRHIEETTQDLDGWKNELDYARKKADIEYEKYCLFMIGVFENTLRKLQQYHT